MHYGMQLKTSATKGHVTKLTENPGLCPFIFWKLNILTNSSSSRKITTPRSRYHHTIILTGTLDAGGVQKVKFYRASCCPWHTAWSTTVGQVLLIMPGHQIPSTDNDTCHQLCSPSFPIKHIPQSWVMSSMADVHEVLEATDKSKFHRQMKTCWSILFTVAVPIQKKHAQKWSQWLA